MSTVFRTLQTTAKAFLRKGFIGRQQAENKGKVKNQNPGNTSRKSLVKSTWREGREGAGLVTEETKGDGQSRHILQDWSTGSCSAS